MPLKARLKNALRELAGLLPPPRRLPPETTSVYDPELLRGQTVLVTGVGRRIGRAIALEMAHHGARVVMVDIDEPTLREAEGELAGSASHHVGYRLDVSDPAHIDAFCEQLAADSIQIDVLVNNVGIGDTAHRLEDLDVVRWRALFDTNVFGPLHLTRRLATQMVEAKRTGSVLFITSVAQTLVSRNPAYSASKAALGMIVKELAVELSAAGIRVNGLAPGGTREPDPAELGHGGGLLASGPIPPRYIGRAAVYLTADYFSAYTTGTVLTIDAGLGLITLHTVARPPTRY